MAPHTPRSIWKLRNDLAAVLAASLLAIVAFVVVCLGIVAVLLGLV